MHSFFWISNKIHPKTNLIQTRNTEKKKKNAAIIGLQNPANRNVVAKECDCLVTMLMHWRWHSIVEKSKGDCQQFGHLGEIKQAKQIIKKKIRATHISTIDKSIKFTPIKYTPCIGVSIWCAHISGFSCRHLYFFFSLSIVLSMQSIFGGDDDNQTDESND